MDKEYRRRVKELLETIKVMEDALLRGCSDHEQAIRFSDVLGKAMNVKVMEREDG